MRNKNFHILEIGTLWPLSNKFVSEILKEKENPTTYYEGSQNNPLNIKKIGWNIKILHTFQICEILEFEPF
jgi:hypothetical protein